MREQLKEANLPERAHKAALKELNRLTKMQSFSPEIYCFPQLFGLAPKSTLVCQH